MDQVGDVADRMPWSHQDFAPIRIKSSPKALVDRRKLGRVEDVTALKRRIVTGIREHGSKIFDLVDGEEGLEHRTAVIGIKGVEDKATGFGIHENQPIRKMYSSSDCIG